MPDGGFGSGLWKNVQAIRFDKDGALRGPVRANGCDGIVVGVDAVTKADNAAAGEVRDGTEPPRPRGRSWRRLFRR